MARCLSPNPEERSTLGELKAQLMQLTGGGRETVEAEISARANHITPPNTKLRRIYILNKPGNIVILLKAKLGLINVACFNASFRVYLREEIVHDTLGSGVHNTLGGFREVKVGGVASSSSPAAASPAHTPLTIMVLG